jgi:plastocyanin
LRTNNHPAIARALPTGLIVLALLIAGCGSSFGRRSGPTGTPPTGSTAPTSRTVVVVMKTLLFIPSVVHAKTGQKILWINQDNAPHNVLYVSGPRFKSSRPVLRPGSQFSIELTQPGTVRYYCSIHPWMKATIVVSR